MRELQLVGYTADLHHLVFTDTAEGGARFKAPIDEDFVATLTEVLELVDPDAVPLGALVTATAQPSPPPAPEPSGEAETGGPGEEEPESEPEQQGAPRGEGPLAGMAAAARPVVSDNGETPAARERTRESKLAPREIQALLRAGQGPRSVAKQAGTDEQWVRRWLPPIEAERDQVLQAVWSSFVAKSRLGVSADPVGEAVEKNLAAKGVREGDPSVEWSASRREGDFYWRVVLKYRSRGRPQRALWHFDPETGALDPRNDLAVDIAWTRPRKAAAKRDEPRPSPRRGRGRTAKKSTAKKAASPKATAKKAARKKAAEKKAAPTKAAAKKAADKKAAAKKAAAKKAAAKKAAAKKAASKKAASKKAAGKKAAKKAPSKKATPKKTPARKAAAKKTPVKRSAEADAAAAKGASAKTAPKKTRARKTESEAAVKKVSPPESPPPR